MRIRVLSSLLLYCHQRWEIEIQKLILLVVVAEMDDSKSSMT